MARDGRVAERVGDLLPRQGLVLDVGAGDGATAERLAGGGRRIIALEPVADRVGRRTPHADVTWVQGVAGELPFADGSLDAAYAAGSYVDPASMDPSRGLAELHRVVRPGGPIVVVAADDAPAAGWFEDRAFTVDASDGMLVATATSNGPPPVRIRGMRLDEADRVGRLTLDAYDRFGEIGGDYRDWLRDPLLRLDTVTALLVAVDADDEVLGTVTYVEPGDGEWEGPEPPHGDSGFRVLAVDPDAQGRGVGPLLVEACRQRAGEAGRHRLFISSMSWMTRAHRMYERAGFVRRPDLDVMFPGGPGVIFTLDLTDEAADRFAPPGPVPATPPWYAEVWVEH